VLDVWYVRTADVRGDDLVAACDAVQSEAERLRGRAFLFEKDRHTHLVTRALCRGVLGHVLARAPGELAFRSNAYGRPELDPPSRLRFNLTNTDGLVACVVSQDHDVGVDAEPLALADRVLEVAATVFGDDERATLARLDGATRREHAVRLWTCKEAYMKARGMGMSLPPRTFEVDHGDGFRLWSSLVDDHLLAICVAGTVAPEPTVRRADLRALLASR